MIEHRAPVGRSATITELFVFCETDCQASACL